MTAAQADLAGPTKNNSESTEEPALDTPRVEDGAAIWRIARDSKTLDLNSSYSYLLWCRDFAATSIVARGAGGEPVGFVTGYIRPDRPDTLMIWQVAVDASQRGRGLAGKLLDGLDAKVRAAHGVSRLETTITPDNTASDRLFRSFARRHGAGVDREVLFPGEVFPEGGEHEPELLYTIGPLTD
ncbi:diaminobutyrate acetyltransferase [Streptomyces sp. A7024]|uniref:L-2,4-diaminobutyric acid acetyltransferase n=1 Tax=Streptomyces coryli TaxID=1128680 RepID=A0A6G4U3D6_9ACTN|nr:diaminobutyrate acetyltransferase [Streptomyces coryli]NGN66593.1 diaminobutyrate acetyltransferase [Streptomyces coryli]